MSTEDFIKKTDKIRKQLGLLRKDINYRDQQFKRGQATYSTDAEINGQFTQINEALEGIQTVVNNFRNNFKDYNITLSQANKRYKTYQQLLNQKTTLKRTYDSLFEKKTEKALFNSNDESSPSFDQKYQTKTMKTKDLYELKKQQDLQQDEALDDLIQNVQNIKRGGKAINEQLSQQDKLLNTLQNKMDDNIEGVSKARRRLTKLLQSSSNCCLISVMVLEIVGLILIWAIWQK